MCIDRWEVAFIFKLTVYVQYIVYAALMTVIDNNLFSCCLAIAEKPVLMYSIKGQGIHVAGPPLLPLHAAGGMWEFRKRVRMTYLLKLGRNIVTFWCPYVLNEVISVR